MIKVHFERAGDGLTVTVSLPPGLQGVFVWQGKEQALHSGVNKIDYSPSLL
jgi:alpha-L-rhamnosidase